MQYRVRAAIRLICDALLLVCASRRRRVDVLAAQQTTATERDGWYQGSADAIRKNLAEFRDESRGITPARDYIILSGSGASACV